MICDRRTFFATASGLTLGVRMAGASAQGANDRIRIGIIGTGGRARDLMNQLKKLPGSKPGMAMVESSKAGVYIVDAFR